jgi:hypothetical protein
MHVRKHTCIHNCIQNARTLHLQELLGVNFDDAHQRRLHRQNTLCAHDVCARQQCTHHTHPVLTSVNTDIACVALANANRCSSCATVARSLRSICVRVQCDGTCDHTASCDTTHYTQHPPSYLSRQLGDVRRNQCDDLLHDLEQRARHDLKHQSLHQTMLRRQRVCVCAYISLVYAHSTTQHAHNSPRISPIRPSETPTPSRGRRSPPG